MKKKGINLRPHIMRAIQVFVPGHTIRKSAMHLMIVIVLNIMKSLIKEVTERMEHKEQKVMKASTLSPAFKMKLPGKMTKFSVNSGQDATMD